MPETVDIRLDPKLLAEAEQLGLDVAHELEHSLRQRIDKRRREIAWQQENRTAIERWNEEVERNGLWYERITRDL
jgi:post-segregation antitoxin (ccd killing protein)